MILDEILRFRRDDVEQAKRLTPVEQLRDRPGYDAPRRGFRTALAASPRAIIAEVKKASPSKGIIRADFHPVEIARTYAAAGATAISILTEERHFQGRLEFLAAIREAVSLPLLRKDFLFDAYQLHEARAWGADAILLIVAALEDGPLRELMAIAAEIGLDALVEVHDEAEVERALAAGADLIGINNRDLRTFVTTLATTEHLAARCGDTALVVSESGINTAADIERLERSGVHTFLIGEALMREPDPGSKLRQLLATAASPNP